MEGFHRWDGEKIVSIRINRIKALEIMRELWKDVNFWAAPGGASVRVETAEEVEIINRVLGYCQLAFVPGRHRWVFHVHLI